MSQARSKKADEAEKAGKNIIMPEVFVSNHMKQQRNYVHYRRNKVRLALGEKAVAGGKRSAFDAISHPSLQTKQDSLLLLIRIKGNNQSTTPQAQKIMSELGLRSINNCVFAKANADTLKKL
jgi:ribosomal protein L30/L7E